MEFLTGKPTSFPLQASQNRRILLELFTTPYFWLFHFCCNEILRLNAFWQALFDDIILN